MNDVIVPFTYLIVGAAVGVLSIISNLFIVTILTSRTPEWKVLFKAALLNRPLTFMHHMNGTANIYAPKSEGDKGEMNTWKLPAHLGVKFHPDTIRVESFYQRKLVNYFSKAPNAISAKEAKAMTDFRDVMGHYGIDITVPVVDALFAADLDPEQMIDGQITGEELETLKQIKYELEETVIKDGAFVYQTVRDFVHTMGFLTSKQLDETKSIMHDNAISSAAHSGQSKDYIMAIIWGIMILVFLAIAKTMFFTSV